MSSAEFDVAEEDVADFDVAEVDDAEFDVATGDPEPAFKRPRASRRKKTLVRYIYRASLRIHCCFGQTHRMLRSYGRVRKV